jgi:hypothetical protein
LTAPLIASFLWRSFVLRLHVKAPCLPASRGPACAIPGVLMRPFQGFALRQPARLADADTLAVARTNAALR